MIKNCLLIIRNKKLNIFDKEQAVISYFGEQGYYFDKITCVAFNCAENIVDEIVESKNRFDNLVILSPSEMEGTLKNFIGALYGVEFKDDRISLQNKNIFILYSDKEEQDKLEEIKETFISACGLRFETSYVKTVGADPQKVTSAVQQAKEISKETDIFVREAYGNCEIELIYSDKLPKTVHDSMIRCILSELQDCVYAIEDVSLTDRLFQLLKLRRMKLSVAESFTGGGISKKLVEVPGISEVFFEGLNTYSNEAKMSRLGVKESTLKSYGAVSEQTAYEMAEGLINTGNCDICIATTGIAGPKSDNTNKPVGLTYLAVGTKEGIEVFEYRLTGNRETITKTAINLALFLVYKTIK